MEQCQCDSGSPCWVCVCCFLLIYRSDINGRRVLSSGWLASYMGQSEVPASTTWVFRITGVFGGKSGPYSTIFLWLGFPFGGQKQGQPTPKLVLFEFLVTRAFSGGTIKKSGVHNCTVHSTQYTVHSTQYTVHSTQYTVHSTQYTVHSTQYTVHSTQYTVHSTQYTVHSTQYTVHSTQYTVHSTQYTVHSTQYTVHSTQYTVHSTQYTVHSTQYTYTVQLCTPNFFIVPPLNARVTKNSNKTSFGVG